MNEIFSLQRTKQLFLRSIKQSYLPMLFMALANLGVLIFLMMPYDFRAFYGTFYMLYGISLVLIFNGYHFRESFIRSGNHQDLLLPYSTTEKFLVYGIGRLVAFAIILWGCFFIALAVIPHIRESVYMATNGYVPNWRNESDQINLIKDNLNILFMILALLMIPSLTFRRNILLINFGVLLVVSIVVLYEPLVVTSLLNRLGSHYFSNTMVTYDLELFYHQIANPMFTLIISGVFVTIAYFKYKEQQA